MIAFAAALKYGEGAPATAEGFSIHPRWDLQDQR